MIVRALEHPHADVAFVLHGLRHEHIVERIEHLALSGWRDIHFNVELNVFRLGKSRLDMAAQAQRGGGCGESRL